jgi:hypothetical protein
LRQKQATVDGIIEPPVVYTLKPGKYLMISELYDPAAGIEPPNLRKKEPARNDTILYRLNILRL